jgi:hypothetical protein
MECNAKTWLAIFTLNQLKCTCGRKLKVNKVVPFDKKYLLLYVNEGDIVTGKNFKNKESCCLYSIVNGKVIPIGTFPIESYSNGNQIDIAKIKSFISNYNYMHGINDYSFEG